MTDRTALIKTLLTDLAQDVAGYTELDALLGRQHSQLSSRDSTSLTATNVALQQLMETLNTRALRRVESLKSLGLSPDDDGMQRLLSALPPAYGEKGKSQWQTLYRLAKRCQGQNNTNGRLLAQQKQALTKVLHPEQAFSYAPGAF
ncbi:flagellar protein FlgN [Parasalinivibrio latis]|uniref:flagellar export chaperone FlgN n=1 Tax=Parasalinivibrio latis TaxID=2952610 RepID=UPI0030E2B765